MADALSDQILAYLDVNWSEALDAVDRAVLAAGLSLHLEHPIRSEGVEQ